MIKKCDYLKKNEYLLYSLYFMILVPIILLPFILKGNGLVGLSDGYNEAFPVFCYKGRIIKEIINNIVCGIEIPQYDFSLIFGGDINKITAYDGIGALSYWPAIFVPLKYMPYAYTFSIIFNWYLGGLFSIYYFKVRDCQKTYALLAGAFSYIFSNYVIHYGFEWPLFLDMFTILPLALAGVDNMLKMKTNKISFLLIFSFLAMALVSFYQVFIIGLIVTIYILVILINRKETLKVAIYSFGKIVVNGLLGVFLGAPILIPSLVAFFESERTSESLIPSIDLLYTWDRYCEKINTIFVKESYMSGLGLLPISIISIFYVFKRKKDNPNNVREIGICIAIFFLGFFLPFFESMMNGFGYPIDRWSFALILLVSLAVTTYLDTSDNDEFMFKNKHKLLVCYFSIFVISTIMFLKQHEYSKQSFLQFVYYFIIWGIYGVYLLYGSNKDRKVKGKCLSIAQITIFISAFSIFLTFAPRSIGGGGLSAGFKSNTLLMENYLTYQDLDKKEDYSFTRTDIYDGSLDWPIVAGTHATTGYYSLVSANYTEFYRKYMISSAINGGSFGTVGLEDRSILQQLLAVVSDLDYNGNVVRMNNTVGMGYLYDNFLSVKKTEDISALERMALLKSTVTLDDNDYRDELKLKNNIVDVKELVDSDIISIPIEVDMNSILLNSRNIVDSEEIVSIFFDKEITDNDEAYVLITDLTAENDDTKITIGDRKVTLRSKEFRDYLKGKNDFLVHVANEVAVSGKLSIIFPPGDYHIGDISLYVLKKSVINAQAVDFNYDTNRVSATVDVDDDKVLFISVPYSEDWSWKIDNQDVESYVADYLFTGIIVPKGSHNIEGNYNSYYNLISWIFSGVTFAVLIGLFFIDNRGR